MSLIWESPFTIQTDGSQNQAEFIFDNAEYNTLLKRINQSYKIGCWNYDWNAVEQGDFFSSIQTGYCEEAAIGLFKYTFPGLKDTDLVAIEIPEMEQLYFGNGVKTVISAKSDRGEKAFQVLALCLSESELSNALIYGQEDIHYVLQEGKVVFLEDYSEILTQYIGNPFWFIHCSVNRSIVRKYRKRCMKI